MENFYTSYVHIYIFTILFHHSLDNDRSAVETSCFTVSFYHKKFYEILTYILFALVSCGLCGLNFVS